MLNLRGDMDSKGLFQEASYCVHCSDTLGRHKNVDEPSQLLLKLGKLPL